MFSAAWRESTTSLRAAIARLAVRPSGRSTNSTTCLWCARARRSHSRRTRTKCATCATWAFRSSTLSCALRACAYRRGSASCSSSALCSTTGGAARVRRRGPRAGLALRRATSFASYVHPTRRASRTCLHRRHSTRSTCSRLGEKIASANVSLLSLTLSEFISLIVRVNDIYHLIYLDSSRHSNGAQRHIDYIVVLLYYLYSHLHFHPRIRKREIFIYITIEIGISRFRLWNQ